jgi:hypothetical protein
VKEDRDDEKLLNARDWVSGLMKDNIVDDKLVTESDCVSAR